MAAGDLVQKGTTVSVGFHSLTNANLIMQSASRTPTATIKAILGEQGAAVTEIYTDPGTDWTLTGVVQNTGAEAEYAALKALIKGSAITVDSIAARVDDITLEVGAEETRVTIKVVKKDGITHA
jgi:hypothetical protein